MPVSRTIAVAAAALLAWSGSAAGQDPAAEPTRATLDAAIPPLFARASFPDSSGCAVGVVHDERLAYSRGFGTANIEHRVPVGPATVFHLASISKQFTAMAILLLARDGRLALDDDVRKYVPEVPDLGATITLRHLLHHTSGLRDLWDLLTFSGRRPDDVVTEHDILSFTSRQRALNAPPGTEFLYNNTGYILLGLVVKRVSGKPLPDFAAERIFGPLGMTRTRYLSDHTTIVPGRATGYARGRDGTLRVRMPSYDVVGSAGVVSTVEDLAAWDRNFYTATVGGPSVIAQMRAPTTLNDGSPVPYGGGINLGTHRGFRIEEHNGTELGYFGELLRVPDRRLSVAVLCNGYAVDAIATARAIADLYLGATQERGATTTGAAAAAPSDTATWQPSAAELERFAGLYHNPVADLVRRIVARDGALHYVRGTGTGDRLVPRGPARFRLPSPAGTIDVSFTPSTMLVSVNGARPSVYTRVRPAVDLPARLSEYTGTYYSPELDVTYTFGILDGELLWRVNGFGPEEFSVTPPPRFEDDFAQGSVSLRFVRDASNRVAAVLLSTGRARGVRFERR